MHAPPQGFFVAPFAIDGRQEGLAFRDCAKLSPKWLALCAAFLKEKGPIFDAAGIGGIAHVRTTMTAAAGAALLTLRVRDRIASSSVLIDGSAPGAQRQVVESFVASMRRIDLVRAAASDPEPFAAALAIRERPLMIVVPWPDENLSDADQDVVRELDLHLAAAFFQCTPGAGGTP